MGVDKILELRKELQVKNNNFEQLEEDSGEGNLLSDEYLKYWLSSQGNNVKTTAIKIIQNLQWKIDSDIGKNFTIKEYDIQKILDTKVVTLQGVDKDGNGVFISRIKLHQPKLRTPETFTKYVLYCVEGIARYMKKHGDPDGKLILVQDLTDYGLDNQDLYGATIIVNVLQNHYPGRLGKCYMLNAPLLFWVLWNALYPFLNAETRSRVQFIYEEQGGLEILRSAIPSNVLPEKYGGTAKDGDLVENVRSLKN